MASRSQLKMQQPKDPNRFYTKNGVEPPEHIAHLSGEEIAELLKDVKHGKWTQQGNMIRCGNCPMPHASPIPVDYLLMGTDDNGNPILQKLG